MHPRLTEVLHRIEHRSADTRAQYLADMAAARRDGPARAGLACSNLAHVFAAAGPDKPQLKSGGWPNIGIVTAFNDMLSAHQPFERFPDLIRAEARACGATAQVAGGVPAMCDGVTQGRDGMEMSLFSRDAIALSTAIALTHEAFDAALLLGGCDKIAPGLFIGTARFGHLPILFAPGGPMPSGIPNAEKAAVRKRYAAGQASRAELLEAESSSYHAAGTCTFYGTANTNQFLLDAMGLHLPGATFIPPNTPLRDAATREAVRVVARATALSADYRPFAEVIDARSFVNAMVILLASGGSTNLALHLVPMARACGVLINWDDLSDLSSVIPLMAHVYPNGKADVNHFQAAGGVAFMIDQLVKAGLMFGDARSMSGGVIADHARDLYLTDEGLDWRPAPTESLDRNILRPVDDPFEAEGGLRLVAGNLGRAIVKTSAVPADRRAIRAPARIYDSQAQLDADFRSGALDGRDFVAVVRFQGPRACGMPELHKLTPPLSVLQDRGARVALLTDGRMSGASGAVLAAIHVTPEALDAGGLARVQEGDIIRIDPEAGVMEAEVEASAWMARTPAMSTPARTQGAGRELFAFFRRAAAPAEQGGGPLLWE